MSTWSKGSKVEKLRREQLEHEGWLVQTWPKIKFGEQDLFGAFDLIAKKLGVTRYEQVKSTKGRMPGMTVETIKNMQEAWKHSCDHDEFYWVGYNTTTKEWRMRRILDPYVIGKI